MTRKEDMERLDIATREPHPYADEFTHEQAWRFDDAFMAATAAATGADFMDRLVEVRYRYLDEQKQETAAAWQRFVTRRVEDIVRNDPGVLHRALARGRARAQSHPPTQPAPGLDAPETKASETGRPDPIVLRRPATTAREGRGPDATAWPANRLTLSDGYVVEPVWSVSGTETGITYDPRRHDVLVTSDPVTNRTVGPSLEADGWECLAVDGDRRLWARDRHVTAQRALDHHDRAAGPELQQRPAGHGPEGMGL